MNVCSSFGKCQQPFLSFLMLTKNIYNKEKKNSIRSYIEGRTEKLWYLLHEIIAEVIPGVMNLDNYIS